MATGVSNFFFSAGILLFVAIVRGGLVVITEGFFLLVQMGLVHYAISG